MHILKGDCEFDFGANQCIPITPRTSPSDLPSGIPSDIPSTTLTWTISDEDAFSIKDQTELDQLKGDTDGSVLRQIFNDDGKTPTNEIHVETRDGAWISNVYLPTASNDGGGSSAVLEARLKFKLTVSSTWDVTVHYLGETSVKSRDLKKGEDIVLVLLPSLSSNIMVWYAEDDGYGPPASVSTSTQSSFEPSNAPTEKCVDVDNWTDSYGDNCSWYEQNDSPGCPDYGSYFSNSNGVIANDACCYCY